MRYSLEAQERVAGRPGLVSSKQRSRIIHDPLQDLQYVKGLIEAVRPAVRVCRQGKGCGGRRGAETQEAQRLDPNQRK